MDAGAEDAMESWQLFATLGANLAAWGAMLGLMWRVYTSLRSEMLGEIAGVRTDLGAEIAGLRGEIADLRGEIAKVSAELAQFRGEMRGDLNGVNAALLVLREDFRAHVHGVRAG